VREGRPPSAASEQLPLGLKRSVSKTTVLETWIPYRSRSLKGSNLVASQEPADGFPLSQGHSLTLGSKIGCLHLLSSSNAPPAAAHHPLTEEVLANGDAVLAKKVLLGVYPLETDPPGPFRQWRRLIGCYQQGHLHTSEGVLHTARRNDDELTLI
jgi:hypothetical protein